VNTLFTITSGFASGASSYVWTVPEDFEIIGDANIRLIHVKAMKTPDREAELWLKTVARSQVAVILIP
jgi:hypothetical protein